jgi:hypothetical protein
VFVGVRNVVGGAGFRHFPVGVERLEETSGIGAG